MHQCLSVCCLRHGPFLFVLVPSRNASLPGVPAVCRCLWSCSRPCVRWIAQSPAPLLRATVVSVSGSHFWRAYARPSSRFTLKFHISDWFQLIYILKRVTFNWIHFKIPLFLEHLIAFRSNCSGQKHQGSIVDLNLVWYPLIVSYCWFCFYIFYSIYMNKQRHI